MKRLEVMKVRPEFKTMMKISAMKAGCKTIADYTSLIASKASQVDNDVEQAINNSKNQKTGWRRYF
jgi:hypothetical protein